MRRLICLLVEQRRQTIEAAKVYANETGQVVAVFQEVPGGAYTFASYPEAITRGVPIIFRFQGVQEPTL
jgi:hypothetical protein